MQEQKLERITPAQAGLDPQCIINMMDRMEKSTQAVISAGEVSVRGLYGYV